MSVIGEHLRRAAVAAGLFLGLVGLLTACTGQPVTNAEIPPPGSDTFQQGYLDGCVSGYHDGGRDGYEADYRKDGTRFAAEADYRDGWLKGHDACYKQQLRRPKIIGL